MLIVTLVIANLVVTIKHHRELADARERRTAILYDMSRELEEAADVATMSKAAARHIGSVFASHVSVFLQDPDGHLSTDDRRSVTSSNARPTTWREDDPAIKKVLRMLFEADGFRVVVASSAARGEHDARLHRPDTVIVDLGLPDLDGPDVIKAIRAWSPVPIVVLAARTTVVQRIAAFHSGADDHVVKPFNGQGLLARVRAVLRRHVRTHYRWACSSSERYRSI